MRIVNDNLDRLQKWLDTHTLNQRLLLLFVGCFVIYLLWYVILARPLATQRTALKFQADSLADQIKTFETKSISISQEIAKNKSQPQPLKQSKTQLEKNEKLATAMTQMGTDSQLIKAILNSHQNVEFMSLKNVVGGNGAVQDNLQLQFRSNYFDTITYLRYLESLPWCIGWDNLAYKVDNYPVATIVLTLHLKSI